MDGMTGFQIFIYLLGSLTFAISCTAVAFALIDRIERPRRRR